MPFVKIQATKEVPTDVLAGLSKIAAETIGKPETYVMVSASKDKMMMSGGEGAAAFVEVKSIDGLTHAVCEKLSAKICDLLETKLQISPDRICLNFIEVLVS
jgi:phenylpyruvate tautomerase